MEFTYKWHGDKWGEDFKKGIIRNLLEAAIYLENSIKSHLGQSYPPQSPPMEYPHLRTGDLRRSITHDVDSSKLQAVVGTNKIYGRYLEKQTNKMQMRPFLENTLKNEWGTIQKILAKRL